jgi:LacI family transcriptional regulator
MSRATMHDVARTAGVSVGTVSNVLNTPGIVAAATREKVHKAIEEVGFIRNNAARQLRAGKSSAIGLVVLDTANPFFGELARGVEDAATASGHLVILCNSGGSEDRQELHLRLLEEQGVTGILITPAGKRSLERARALRGRGTPMVLLDAHSRKRGECSVAVDNVTGGLLAADHLAQSGHRRIGLVNGPITLEQCADRREGFLAGLSAAGIKLDRGNDVEVESMTISEGFEAVSKILDSPKPPSALFCTNDLLAVGAERAAVLRGLAIPDELAIVGYDDVQFASMSQVPLTSIRQPAYDLGYRATKLLFEEAVPDGKHRHKHMTFEPELIVRESTRTAEDAQASSAA